MGVYGNPTQAQPGASKTPNKDNKQVGLNAAGTTSDLTSPGTKKAA